MKVTAAIRKWMTQTENLARTLGCTPSEVYDHLLGIGAAPDDSKGRTSIDVESALTIIADCMGPMVAFTPMEALTTVLRHPFASSVLGTAVASTEDAHLKMRNLISRNADGKGYDRFRKEGYGKYRVNLTLTELIAAVYREIEAQGKWVTSSRIQTLFGLTYQEVIQVTRRLKPLTKQRVNEETGLREWKALAPRKAQNGTPD